MSILEAAFKCVFVCECTFQEKNEREISWTEK